MPNVKRIRCRCGGWSECKLCRGAKKYEYEVGPMGYWPFPCPTCDGNGTLTEDDGTQFTCKTCQGERSVDPANPPLAGLWDVLTKIFFGA